MKKLKIFPSCKIFIYLCNLFFAGSLSAQPSGDPLRELFQNNLALRHEIQTQIATHAPEHDFLVYLTGSIACFSQTRLPVHIGQVGEDRLRRICEVARSRFRINWSMLDNACRIFLELPAGVAYDPANVNLFLDNPSFDRASLDIFRLLYRIGCMFIPGSQHYCSNADERSWLISVAHLLMQATHIRMMQEYFNADSELRAQLLERYQSSFRTLLAHLYTLRPHASLRLSPRRHTDPGGQPSAFVAHHRLDVLIPWIENMLELLEQPIQGPVVNRAIPAHLRPPNDVDTIDFLRPVHAMPLLRLAPYRTDVLNIRHMSG